MFRRSSRFGPRKSGHPGLKLFFYGLIAGAILVFVITRLNKAPEPVQLVINTPIPTVVEQPEQYIWSESGNIGVLTPTNGDAIQSPLEVKGKARVFESTFNLRLTAIDKDKKGKITETVLVDTTAMSNAPDAGQYGDFNATLQFDTDAKTGTLEVFDKSAKDGTEIDKVTVPLKFR